MTDLEQRKRELEARLADLRQRLASLKVDAARAHSSDWAEQAQERENDEVVDAIGAETRESIAKLTSALERIEDGSYGVCKRCGGEIAAARLQASPEATLCINCAD